MNTVRTAIAALAAAAVGLVTVASPATADEETKPSPVDLCLDRHPGAVPAEGVTPGNDLVCVERTFIPSEGDDTYLWVGADTNGAVILRGTLDRYSIVPDPGTDTLSLADWTVPLVETYTESGVGGLFGIRITAIDSPEVIRYTDFDDVIGDPNVCARMGGYTGGVVPISHYTGLGADTVQCTVGNIFTEGDDDTILGVTDGAAVFAGTGNDTVTGDGTSDHIDLGAGDDRAFVRDGGVDAVMGGAGVDTVVASRDDRLSAVEFARYPAVATPAPPKSPKPPRCGHSHEKHHKHAHGKHHRHGKGKGHSHMKHHKHSHASHHKGRCR